MADYASLRKMSGLSLCSGVVAGLVVITPGSGFVPPPALPWASIIMGVVGGAATNGAALA